MSLHPKNTSKSRRSAQNTKKSISNSNNEPNFTLHEISGLEEIQGLYGPVAISEKLVQQIWLRGDFSQSYLNTLDKEPLKIHHPGRWNQVEGPDFKDCSIEIDGHRLRGDVEVHFHQRDWKNHCHDTNLNFDSVILHVVLFEPGPAEPRTITSSGKEPHTLVLLPYLQQDLEEYALEEALLALENRDKLSCFEALLEKSVDGRREYLIGKSRLRWQCKVDSRVRLLDEKGWSGSCHSLALETLGYKRNRLPMLRLAQKDPLAEMAALGKSANALFEEARSDWKLIGLRPANHPRNRLEQYMRVLDHNLRWPEALLEWSHDLKTSTGRLSSTADFRRTARMKQLKGQLSEKILGNNIGGSRLDTLVCDALLPLLAARGQTDLFNWWFHWYPGDLPSSLFGLFKHSPVNDRSTWPMSNGWKQGALQLCLESLF